MNRRFFNVVFATILSIGLVGQANAVLIVGDSLQDSSGVDWTYLGSFNLAGGQVWNDADGSCDVSGAGPLKCWGDYAKPLNAIEAAALFFALGANEVFATSTVLTLVDHLAYYDEFGPTGTVATKKGESIKADVDGDGFYSKEGDTSALIIDRAKSSIANHVFKRAINVSAPSTIAIFALVLLGLGASRLKR
jgi:hypothetical protein